MNAVGALALAGALQGVVLAAALWRRRSARRANRWLALLMALVAVRLANQLAAIAPPPGWPSLSLRFTVPLLFAVTPLLYLYLRMLACRAEEGGRTRWHFVPALAALAYTAPFYWAVLVGPPGEWAGYGQSLRWESTLLNALLVLQAAAYLGPIRRLLRRFDERARQVASNLDHVRLRWMRWLAWALVAQVSFLAVAVALQVLGAGGPVVEHRGLLLAAFMVLTIYGTGYLALSQPALFAEEQAAGPKYGRSSLTAERAEAGARLLRSLLERERLYAQEDLTLAVLAHRASLPPGHVSQIINERLGTSFYDLVNGYRVEEAKRLLLDPETADRKLLAIGLEVGFRSKAAFNRVFKQSTGLTPSEFRASRPELASTVRG